MLFRTPAPANQVVELPLSSVDASPYQPRKSFSPAALDELTESIRANGLLQPVTVRPMDNGRYQLIVGERRLRACRMAGLERIRALVIQADDRQAAILAMVENLQREGLHFFEEAEGYCALIQEHNLSQKEVAERLGRQQSTVANKIRLLRLSLPVRSAILRNHLTERHARALLKLWDENEQLAIIEKVARGNLNVQATEALVEQALQRRQQPARPKVRRVYADWRLLSNSVKMAVDQMRSAGVAVRYTVRDMGDQIELKVLVPKNQSPVRGKAALREALPGDNLG